MKNKKNVESAVVVIFGAGGDLTWRKLVPAFFSQYIAGNLPDKFRILGADLKDMEAEEFRKNLWNRLKEHSRRGSDNKEAWETFSANLFYDKMDFKNKDAYSGLGDHLDSLDKEWDTKAVRVFYLAVPPALIEPIVQGLDKARLQREQERTRIVVEKPFGHDLQSAKDLNSLLKNTFQESQIYRIDHYLGKETVQNILAFRFSNPLFEPIWDRRYVDHVNITVAETLGVEHRGAYYEKAGALRDMVQNHLIQLLCSIAMEPPVSFDADEIRNKKLDLLRSIRKIPHHKVQEFAARGQYDEGWIASEKVPPYREEPDVSPDSNRETFAALKLFVDNWRWQDVPFYLRSGKRLAAHVSEISICFRAVPHQSFPTEAALDQQPSRITVCIQPYEGIVIKFQAKLPGPAMRLKTVDMHFNYQDVFQAPSPDAYETLLVDILEGDATLFMRADQVEMAWSVITPVLEMWEANEPSHFPNYAAGTWGPEDAEVLIAKDGRTWFSPTILKVDTE
jgi:glucose-6-phosphate 1-dehydrogenase